MSIRGVIAVCSYDMLFCRAVGMCMKRFAIEICVRFFDSPDRQEGVDPSLTLRAVSFSVLQYGEPHFCHAQFGRFYEQRFDFRVRH